MIVLNDWNAAAYKPELLPVSAPVAGVSYYGFNTLNEQGVQAIRDTAGILTSNFHVFRARMIAEKWGIPKVYGIPSKSDPILFPHLCVRECLAIIKDRLMGNM